MIHGTLHLAGYDDAKPPAAVRHAAPRGGSPWPGWEFVARHEEEPASIHHTETKQGYLVTSDGDILAGGGRPGDNMPGSLGGPGAGRVLALGTKGPLPAATPARPPRARSSSGGIRSDWPPKPCGWRLRWCSSSPPLAWTWQCADGEGPRSAALLVASGAVGTLLLLAAEIWLPWSIARLWADPFLYYTWPAWRVLGVLLWPLIMAARFVDAVMVRLSGRPPSVADEESFDEEIRTIVSPGTPRGAAGGRRPGNDRGRHRTGRR